MAFNDIEQHKFDWKGRVVRLEVTPKILESKQIGEDTYRGFLKDTATPNHYGIVEFPHDALVKLGFLKKIVSGAHAWEDLEKMGALGRTEGEPVSFYVAGDSNRREARRKSCGRWREARARSRWKR